MSSLGKNRGVEFMPFERPLLSRIVGCTAPGLTGCRSCRDASGRNWLWRVPRLPASVDSRWTATEAAPAHRLTTLSLDNRCGCPQPLGQPMRLPTLACAMRQRLDK